MSTNLLHLLVTRLSFREVEESYATTAGLVFVVAQLTDPLIVVIRAI